MSIAVECPSCAAKLVLPEAAAGRRVKCRHCQAPVPVPAAEEVPLALAPEPDWQDPEDDEDDLDDRPRRRRRLHPLLFLLFGIVGATMLAGAGYAVWYYGYRPDPPEPLVPVEAKPLDDDSPKDWTTFKGAQYTVFFPKAGLEPEDRILPVRKGQPVLGVRVAVKMLNLQGKSLLVQMSVIDPAVVKQYENDADGLAEHFRKYLEKEMTNLGYPDPKCEPCTVDGRNGIDMEFDGPAFGPARLTIRRIVVAKNILYVLCADRFDPKTDRPMLKTFLDSLHIK